MPAPRRPWTVPELAAVAAIIGKRWPGPGAVSAVARQLGRPLREVSRKKREVKRLLMRHAEQCVRRRHLGSPS